MSIRCVVLALTAAACLQAAAGSFTIEQVMSAPFAYSLSAAPRGSAVAWMEDEQGRRNIYVASAPQWKARKLTTFNEDDGQQIDQITWAPDGSYLLFTRGGDFENGGTNPNPNLSLTEPGQDIWRVGLDGTPARRLLEGQAAEISPKGDVVAFLRNGQIWTMQPSGTGAKQLLQQKWKSEALNWSPDGARLAFVSSRGDHSFIGVFDFAQNRLRYIDASVDRDSAPAWSPDSSQVAYLRIPASRRFVRGPRREGEPWSIRVFDVRNNTAHAVFHAQEGPGSVFHYVDAEHQILWTANNRLVFPWERTGWCHLYSIPADGGSAVELTPGIGIVETVALAPDKNTIYYSGNFKDIDRRHIWNVNASGSAAPQEITQGEDIEWGPAPATGRALAYLASSYNQKAHAVIRVDGKSSALAPEIVPTEYPAKELVKPEPVIITASDGLAIHCQLFLPPNDGSERHPALVFFHGGSRRQMVLGFHYMYYYSNAYALNQYFANHGYVVLSVNYRSGIGYGLNFREAIHYGAAGASEFNDVMGAGLYLKSRPDVDPKRIGVWGGSYGGYLTALALARASDLFAAGVDFHGVHDWSTLFDSIPAHLDPLEQRTWEHAKEVAFASSPLADVATWHSPVLLIHGDDDRNVPFSQTVRLVEALRKQHVHFEELIIPNEIHDFLRQRDWVRAYEAAAHFLASKMGQNEERTRIQ